jgi:radical SAM superfamily enzyme YgiQ (UPF0313 family)
LFSFSYEGDFDKIPGIFSALGIPINAAERNRHHPLMIAGGAAVASNAPALAQIFDVLVPGEAESTLKPMLNAFLDKGIGGEVVADLPGLWVPALSSRPNPAPTKCNIDLEPAWAHIVSANNAFGGAHIIEVMRGCPRNCSFCLARVIYEPVRCLSKERLSKWLDAHPDCNDLGLVAPSLFDHPEIEEIFAMLLKRNIRIRNSSVKWERLSDNILEALRASNVKSLTLAPETGSERLRAAMGKPLNKQRFFASLAKINKAGFKHVKLYFVAGLPGENEADTVETIEFLQQAQIHAGTTSLSAAFSIFVPKNGTPWQNENYLTLPEIKRKIKHIKSLIKEHSLPIKANFVSPQEVARQIRLSQIGPELAQEYAREAAQCKENRLFSRNQFSALEF